MYKVCELLSMETFCGKNVGGDDVRRLRASDVSTWALESEAHGQWSVKSIAGLGWLGRLAGLAGGLAILAGLAGLAGWLG